MKLDTYPFPMNVNMINFEEKRVLVHTSQADSTQRKNVIVLDEPRLRMVKPRNPEPGQWQVNKALRARTRVKPTLDMLLEKYAEQQRQNMFQRLGAETIEITPARTTHREEEVNGASQ
jgi:hypothetical protein